MLRNTTEMESNPNGTVVGLYLHDDPKQVPQQIALKTAHNKWALAGRKESWTTEELFDVIQRHELISQLMRRI